MTSFCVALAIIGIAFANKDRNSKYEYDLGIFMFTGFIDSAVIVLALILIFGN